jgi:hypothetical protein
MKISENKEIKIRDCEILKKLKYDLNCEEYFDIKAKESVINMSEIKDKK